MKPSIFKQLMNRLCATFFIISTLMFFLSTLVGATSHKEDGSMFPTTEPSNTEQKYTKNKKTNFHVIKEQKKNNPLRNQKWGVFIKKLMLKWDKHIEKNAETGFQPYELKKSFKHSCPFVRMKDVGDVQVYVQVKDASGETLDRLSEYGLQIELHNDKLNKVQGWIEIDLLDALTELPEVIKTTIPQYGRSNKGSVTTEGDIIIKSNKLRVMGFNGKGIRVGVISDGANNWQASQASGDLPSGGITLFGSCTRRAANPSQCVSERTCNEGTAMAEIIHDLAPEAELAVGSADTSLEFMQKIDQLVNDFQANIIVDDLGYYAEPYFEDGELADAVAEVSTQVLFVSSAGNSADSHYEKNYVKTANYYYHDFGISEGAASNIYQGILVPPEDYIWVIMQWNDPFSSPSNDYDLYLVDEYNDVIAGSTDDQTFDGSSPIEGFCYYNPTTEEQVKWLVVDKYNGIPRRLEIFTLGAWDTRYNHPSGSIIGHSAVSKVVTVGAINADDEGHDTVAYYSSRGPSRIDYPFLENRNKPDLIGIDGVKITGAGGFGSPFYGTSASAPHVAGIAAQLMSIAPTVRADQVRQALIDGAKDLGSPGFDYTYGYGLVDALRAKELLNYGSSIVPFLLLLLDD